MATEAQTPEPISEKNTEGEIKSLSCVQLHTTFEVEANDQAEKESLTEDKNSKAKMEAPYSENATLLKGDSGYNVPSSETFENATKTDATRNDSSPSVETAVESSLEFETVSERLDVTTGVEEERENQISFEKELEKKIELKKLQEATMENNEAAKTDSEAKVMDTNTENKRETRSEKPPAVPSDEKNDENISLILPERRTSDCDEEYIHSVSNEQNLDTTAACIMEAEVTNEESTAKKSDASIDETGSPTETDLNFEGENEEKLHNIEVAKEEQNKEETTDNKFYVQSLSEEIEGKMIEESSQVVSEYQNLTTSEERERFQGSHHLGLEGQDLKITEERDNLEQASSMSDINLGNTSVSQKEKEREYSKNLTVLALEEFYKMAEEKADIGSASATENIEGKAYEEQECTEQQLDAGPTPVKQQLAETSIPEDKIEGKEQEKTFHLLKVGNNLEISHTCGKIESEQLERQDNPHDNLEDFIKFKNIKDTKDSACVSACEETTLEHQNVIQNIEEVNKEGMCASDNVPTASVLMATEEINLQKAEPEDGKPEDATDLASEGRSLETSHSTKNQKEGEKSEEAPKLAKHPPLGDNTDIKSPEEDMPDILPVSQASGEENLQKNKIEDSGHNKATKPIPDERIAVNESCKADNESQEEETPDVLPTVQILIEQSLQKYEILGEEIEKATVRIYEDKTVETEVFNLVSEEKIQEADDSLQQDRDEQIQEISNEVHELPTVSDNAEEKPDALFAAQAFVQECLQMEKIEASGPASEEKILEAIDKSLQHGGFKDEKIEETSNQVSELSTANERDKTGEENRSEETSDVLPVVQTLVENILQKDEIQGEAKKATEQISEKTTEEIKASDVASKEKISKADDALLLSKEIEGEEIGGTSVSEFPTVNESKKMDKENLTEEKQDLIPVSPPLAKECSQKDEIQGKEPEKAAELVPEDKTPEVIEVSDFAPNKKFPEARDTSLLDEEAEGSKITETSTLVSELYISDESENADKQCQMDKSLDAFPITTQAIVDEKIQKDEIQGMIKYEKVAEQKNAEITEETKASDLVSDKKCQEAIETSSEHEEKGAKIVEISHLVSEIYTVDETSNVNEQIPAKEKAHALPDLVRKSLQREEPAPIPEKKTGEATMGFDHSSQENSSETNSTTLHHEEEILETKEQDNLVCELPIVDGCDNAEEKPDTLPLVPHALVQENLQTDTIKASGLASEGIILEAKDESLQHEEIKGAKMEATFNQDSELLITNERDNASKETMIVERPEVLPVVQTLVNKILQKDEIKGGLNKNETEQISQEKTAEEIKSSDLACEDEIQERDDTILLQKDVEGNEIGGTLASELPSVNESRMTDNCRVEIQGFELQKETEVNTEKIAEEIEQISQDKTTEEIKSSDLACEDEIQERDDIILLQKEVEGNEIGGTLASELPSVNESKMTDNCRVDIQGFELEKETEVNTEKVAEEIEVLDLVSKDKCLKEVDASVQHEEGVKIVEISHLVSEISTANESQRKDKEISAEDKADASQAMVEESLQKDEIDCKESERAAGLMSEQKTTEAITAFDLAYEKKSPETEGTALHHKDVDAEMEEYTDLACEIPPVDASDNAEGTPEGLPVAQTLIEENLQIDKTNASGQASEENILEDDDKSLQHAEVENEKIKGTPSQVSELSTNNEGDKASKESQREETPDVLPIVQALAEKILQKDDIQGREGKKETEEKSVDKTAQEIKVSDLACEKKIQETDGTILFQEVEDNQIQESLVTTFPEVIGSKLRESCRDKIQEIEPEKATALIAAEKIAEEIEVSDFAFEEKCPKSTGASIQHEEGVKIAEISNILYEISTADESDEMDEQIQEEEKTDSLPSVQALQQESLKRDEIHWKESERATELIHEQKTEEETRAFDLASEGKRPETNHEQVEYAKMEESTHLVRELSSVTGNLSSAEEKNNALPVKSSEATIHEKTVAEVKASDLGCEEKNVTANDADLQHGKAEGTESEDTTHFVSETSTINECDNADVWILAKENEDSSPIARASIEENLEKDEIQSTKHKEGVKIAEISNLVYEISTADESDETDEQIRAEKKTDSLPSKQALGEDSLKKDEIHLKESERTAELIHEQKTEEETRAFVHASEDKSPEKIQVENVKMEESNNLICEFSSVTESDNAGNLSPAEEKNDALPIQQASVDESLQKDEFQGNRPVKSSEATVHETTVAEMKASDLGCEEKNVTANDAGLQHGKAEGTEREETSHFVSETSTVNEHDNADVQILTEENEDSLPIACASIEVILKKDGHCIKHEEEVKITEISNLNYEISTADESEETDEQIRAEEKTDSLPSLQASGEESLKKDEIHWKEPKRTTELIHEQKTEEETRAFVLASEDKSPETIQEQVVYAKMEESNNLICEFSSTTESDNAGNLSPAEEKNDALPIQQASVDESLQKDEFQGKQPVKSSEATIHEKTVAEVKASDFGCEEKNETANDAGLQHGKAEGTESEEITHFLSETSTANERDNADVRILAKENEDSLPIARASIEENLEKDEIHSIKHECVKIAEISNLVYEISTANESDETDEQIQAEEKTDSLPSMQASGEDSSKTDEIHWKEPERTIELIHEQKTEEETRAFVLASEGKSPETIQEQVEYVKMEESNKLICELSSVTESDNAGNLSPAEEKNDALPIQQVEVDESLQEDEIQGNQPVKSLEATIHEKTVAEVKALDLGCEENNVTANDAGLQHGKAEGTESEETTNFVSEPSTVNERDNADEQILTEEKEHSLPIAQAAIEKTLEKDEIHSKEHERGDEIIPEQKTTYEIIQGENVPTKTPSKEEYPHEIPVTIVPVDEKGQVNRKLGAVKCADVVSENLGVESSESKTDSGDPKNTTSSISSIIKEDVSTEDKIKEMDLDTYVFTQTAEDACLQIEAGQESDDITQVISEGVGDHSNKNQQKQIFETIRETGSTEGPQNEDEEVYKIPKSEHKEHLSEAKEAIGVTDRKIPDEEKEPEESIGSLSAIWVSTDDGAGEKQEETLKQQVSDKCHLQATNSSLMLENETQNEDTTHDINLNATTATHWIEKPSEIMSKDQYQSDINDESSMTESQAGENMKTSREETEIEMVEKATDNDSKTGTVETCAATKPCIHEDNEKLNEMEASFEEDKDKKGGKPAAAVNEIINIKFKDSDNEAIAGHLEMNDASENSFRETQNNDVTFELASERDILEGEKNDQSLEMVAEWIGTANASTKKDKFFTQNEDPGKKVEESIQDRNQEVSREVQATAEGKNTEKQREEKEHDTKELVSLSTVEDTVEVSSQESEKQKILAEETPQSGYQNCPYESNNAVETTIKQETKEVTLSDIMSEEQDKRAHPTEEETKDLTDEEDPSNTADTSIDEPVSIEESREIQIGEHHEATEFTPEEHVVNGSDNIKLDLPISTESEKRKVDSESGPEEQNQEKTTEIITSGIEIPMDNDCHDTLPAEASMQENTQNEAVQMKTEDHFKEQDKASKSMGGQELEKTHELEFLENSEDIDAGEKKEIEITEKEEFSYKDIEKDETDREKLEAPNHRVLGVEMAVACENVEKQINTVSSKEVKGEIFQEEQSKVIELEDAAPESKPQILNHETKEVNGTTKNEIPNEVPTELEGEGGALVLNTALVGADTGEENLEEDKGDRRLGKLELEAENQILEMIGKTGESVNEEVYKGVNEEQSVLELNTRVDIDENPQEDKAEKKLNEPELEAENQIFEMKDTIDKSRDEHLNKEDKKASLPSMESYCVETVLLKDEEDPNLSTDASPITITSAEKNVKEVPKEERREAAVMEPETVSIRVNTIEECLNQDREVKNLSEHELEDESQILQKDAYDMKKNETKDESPNEEIIQDKNSSLPSTEEGYQADPTDKKKTVTLKEEDEPYLIIDASTVAVTFAEETAKEEVCENIENASYSRLEKQIHEATNANGKNIEFAITETSVLVDQITVEKLRNRSIDNNTINSNDTVKSTASSAIELSGVSDASPVETVSDFELLEDEKPRKDSNFMSKEKVQETIGENEVKEVCIAKPEKAPCLSSIKQAEEREVEESKLEDYQDFEKEILPKQGYKGLEEAKVMLQNIKVPIEASYETSKENLQNLDKISSMKATAVDQRLGEVSEVELELETAENQVDQMEINEEQMGKATEDSTEETIASDSGKIRLSDLLQKSTIETMQTVEHFKQESSLITDGDSPKTKQVAAVQIKEREYEEKDEEEEKHIKDESVSDAPVIVEASGDADLKPAHKKSHSILSGVGSKVKHSIAKVKKAITGKSSHQKTVSLK